MVFKVVDDEQTWDNFVKGNPNATIFHMWDYLKIIEKYSNTKLIPYGIYDGENLIGIIPLYVNKKLGLKGLYSPPKDMGIMSLGFLFDEHSEISDNNQSHSIPLDLNYVLNGLHPNIVNIHTSKHIDIESFKRAGYEINIHYDYLLDLDQSLDKIWQDFNNGCRRTIKKCEQLQLSIKRVDDVDRFYHLMTTRLNCWGTTYFDNNSLSFYRDILKTFPDHLNLYFIYWTDLVVAVCLCSGFNGEYTLQWGGAGKINQDIDCNEYMIWELIKIAKKEGYHTMINPDADTRRLVNFKSKFNFSLNHRFSIYRNDLLVDLLKYPYNLVKSKESKLT